MRRGLGTKASSTSVSVRWLFAVQSALTIDWTVPQNFVLTFSAHHYPRGSSLPCKLWTALGWTSHWGLKMHVARMRSIAWLVSSHFFTEPADRKFALKPITCHRHIKVAIGRQYPHTHTVSLTWPLRPCISSMYYYAYASNKATTTVTRCSWCANTK